MAEPTTPAPDPNPSPTPAPTPSPTEPTPAPTNEPAKTPEPAKEPGSLIGEKKEGEASEAAPYVAPTVEDLGLPKDAEIDQPLVDEFLGIASELKLSKENAAKLVALQTKAMEAVSERGNKLWLETQDTWQKEVKADPEVGGDRLQPVLGGISKLLDEYGSPELREVFSLTGAGNNIHMVKFLNKISKALGEASPVRGSPGAPERDAATILYGNQGK